MEMETEQELEELAGRVFKRAGDLGPDQDRYIAATRAELEEGPTLSEAATRELTIRGLALAAEHLAVGVSE